MENEPEFRVWALIGINKPGQILVAMDPALAKQREAFKKRAMAVPVVEKRSDPSKASPAAVREKSSKQRKKKSKLRRPKPQKIVPENVDQIKQTALLAHRSNNPSRVLKAVIDMMKQRYTLKVYDRLTLEEILESIGLTDLRTDTRQWLSEALQHNTKMHYSLEKGGFVFKPALGLAVRNRKQLLAKLRENEKEGLGGVLMCEVKEALPNPSKAVDRLEQEKEVMKITRADKEEVLFYNNRDFEIEVDEDLRSLWRSVSVDHHSEADIEKYLQNVGLGAMQGETRKRKAPSQLKDKSKKRRARQQKVLNTHLETGLLRDYSQGD